MGKAFYLSKRDLEIIIICLQNDLAGLEDLIDEKRSAKQDLEDDEKIMYEEKELLADLQSEFKNYESKGGE